LKIDHGPGYRVYYTERRDELIVLLAGGDKSTQSPLMRGLKRLPTMRRASLARSVISLVRAA